MAGEDDRTAVRRSAVAAIALSIAFGSAVTAGPVPGSAKDQYVSAAASSFRRMADGKEWTTANTDVDASDSYCYDDVVANCRRYGRMYTWTSAQRVCQLLGNGWGLPTDDEWRQLTKLYGGVSADSADKGRTAFAALLSGGTSGFDAVLGGNRSHGKYGRLEAHGFTGRHQTAGPTTPPFTTSAGTGKLFIASLTARRRWPFPCVASGSDRIDFRPRDPISADSAQELRSAAVCRPHTPAAYA